MDLETEKPELPKGVQNTAADKNTAAPDVVDFERIAKESAKSLEAQQDAQIKKETRGRKALPRDEQGNIIRPGEPSQAPETPLLTSEDRKASEDLAKELQPLLSDVVKMPFNFANNYFENPEIEISEDESKAPTYYLSKFLKYQFPELESHGPKKFNLYAFLISMMVLLLKKIPLMQKPKKRIIDDENPENPASFENEPLPSSTPSWDAGNFSFRTRR